MVRTTTWNNLGTVAKTNSYKQLLQDAGLDYTTVAKDLFTEYEGTKIQVPNKKVILREDTSEVFGIVSDRYQLCQNIDALDFVDYLPDVTLKSAGSAGSAIWMIGTLPEVNVLGDSVAPHLIFQNSHDGSCSIKTTICMLRIVCQNQFVSAFENSPATITIRHQGDLDEKLIVTRKTMQGVYDYVKNYNDVANKFASERVTPAVFNQIVEEYFKIPEEASERTKLFILDRRDNFRTAYDADDNQNFKGTKWGIINAFSDLATHEEYARKTVNYETNRFLNSLNPSQMTEFMNLVEAA